MSKNKRKASRKQHVNRNYKDSNKARDYLEKFPNNLERAVDMAVKECIDEGILVDFLRKNRGEVKDVILTEYNEELHIKSEKNSVMKRDLKKELNRKKNVE